MTPESALNTVTVSEKGGLNFLRADKTSAMLALAPGLVRRDRIADLKHQRDQATVRAAMLDPAVTWAWSRWDKRIADLCVIGDAGSASIEHGRTIVARVVEAAAATLRQLVDN